MPSSVSIVMPVYNEAGSVRESIQIVLRQPVVSELVIVDDCSTDGSGTVLDAAAQEDSRVKVFHHSVNQGKGAALRTGFSHVSGDIVVIQDADFEYDPCDYPRLLAPILDGRADVVFGSRFLRTGDYRVLRFWHRIGNKFLTLLSNMTTNLNITDMETCYKVFRREILQKISIEENRFGVEPEITAKVARLGVRVVEVAISYCGRSHAEGKKIGWKDFFRALWCIAKYGLIHTRR